MDHKDFVSFKGKFEKVGTLKIKDSFKKTGSRAAISSFDELAAFFQNYDKDQKTFGYKKFPVNLLCER